MIAAPLSVDATRIVHTISSLLLLSFAPLHDVPRLAKVALDEPLYDITLASPLLAPPRFPPTPPPSAGPRTKHDAASVGPCPAPVAATAAAVVVAAALVGGGEKVVIV